MPHVHLFPQYAVVVRACAVLTYRTLFPRGIARMRKTCLIGQVNNGTLRSMKVVTTSMAMSQHVQYCRTSLQGPDLRVMVHAIQLGNELLGGLLSCRRKSVRLHLYTQQDRP